MSRNQFLVSSLVWLAASSSNALAMPVLSPDGSTLTGLDVGGIPYDITFQDGVPEQVYAGVVFDDARRTEANAVSHALALAMVSLNPVPDGEAIRGCSGFGTTESGACILIVPERIEGNAIQDDSPTYFNTWDQFPGIWDNAVALRGCDPAVEFCGNTGFALGGDTRGTPIGDDRQDYRTLVTYEQVIQDPVASASAAIENLGNAVSTPAAARGPLQTAQRKLDMVQAALQAPLPDPRRALGQVRQALVKIEKAIRRGLDPAEVHLTMKSLADLARGLANDELAAAIARAGDQVRISRAQRYIQDAEAACSQNGFAACVGFFKRALEKAQSA